MKDSCPALDGNLGANFAQPRRLAERGAARLLSRLVVLQNASASTQMAAAVRVSNVAERTITAGSKAFLRGR